MDSKRSHGKPQTTRHGGGGGGGGGSSSSDSSCGSPASPSRSSPAPTRAPGPGGNAFANDGSFMEMFKKKMEEEEEKKRKRETLQTGGEQRRATPEQGQTPEDKKPPPVTSFVRGLAVVGKRRGGVFLKTGMVAKKQKDDSEAEPGKSDAWSKYMAEVKKYKAHQCGDDDKTRPLVK
ncbi:telomerase RNA component interacting RNase isoform X1 [Etheostoma spectabile]|uniref:telomerase RNA component interacting RNase isoform X1 n=1 Tax=Etheostoma spectabile TaxID=54343 RepID=UPI0013AF5922|nr:telomerase RNA component interacting RNase isoform X1 [Etheostoma spectabile]